MRANRRALDYAIGDLIAREETAKNYFYHFSFVIDTRDSFSVDIRLLDHSI